MGDKCYFIDVICLGAVPAYLYCNTGKVRKVAEWSKGFVFCRMLNKGYYVILIVIYDNQNDYK